MRVIDYFNPKTELNTWNNFKELDWKQKGVVLLVSAIAAAAFLLYGGFVACRALTHYFHKVPESTPILQKPVAEWKQMMYNGLSKQLKKVGYTHGTAEETGDCFFDAVAQELNKLRPDTHFTKKKIREDLKAHLETCNHGRYRDLQEGDVEHTYDQFCQRIGICAGDTEEAPIWGNKTCLQLVADIYRVNIDVFSVMAFELTLFEALEERYE